MRILLSIFFLSILSNTGLLGFPIDLSNNQFFVREGFQSSWVESDFNNCSECKQIKFQDEIFKSIRIKNLYLKKFEEANETISLSERIADHFTVSTSFHLENLPNQNLQYGLFFERIGINWEIYLNGKLLKSELFLDEKGKVQIHKATRFPMIYIPSHFFQTGENILHIHLVGDIRDYYLGVFLNSPEIDEIEKITFRQIDFLRLCIQISYFLLFLIYLIFYFLHPEQRFNLYFSLGVLAFGIYRFFDSHYAFILIEDSYIQQNFLTISYLLLPGIMMLFINQLIDDKAHILTKITCVLFIPLSLIKLCLPHAYTFPFLLNIAGNIAMVSFPYLVFYRIGYTGLKDFVQSYKDHRAKEISFAFFKSLQFTWNHKLEFVLFVFIGLTYTSFITDYILFSKYDEHFYSSDFAFLVFYGLMGFFTYRRKFELVEKHKREMEKLNWEKEKEKLNSELAIHKERESIFADIHDNLGGKLLDLSFQLNDLKTDPISKNKISHSMKDVLDSLRNRLLIFEDMSEIESNFQEGLNLFLLRRYTKAGRKIFFNEYVNFKPIKSGKDKYPILLNALSELVNNDLKYGIGNSIWGVTLEKDYIIIKFSSHSIWDANKHSKGNGSRTIRERIASIGGEFFEATLDSKYKVEIILHF